MASNCKAEKCRGHRVFSDKEMFCLTKGESHPQLGLWVEGMVLDMGWSVGDARPRLMMSFLQDLQPSESANTSSLQAFPTEHMSINLLIF